MTTRIGRIPYLNSEVFYFGMAEEPGIEMSSLVPHALSVAALEGGIDAGPVPLVACFELEDVFKPLGDFCIATQVQARSIFLFSKRPIHELDDAVIGVTGETTTSVRLMKTLLSLRFNVTPRRYVALHDDSTDAFLLIGDQALRNRHGIAGHPYVYDLGEEWHRWTGLPFVFARWLVRRDLDDEKVRWLESLVSRSIEKGLAAVEEIADSRRDLNMTHLEVIEYIKSFHYHLGKKELMAIEKFRHLLSSSTPDSPPLPVLPAKAGTPS